MVIGAGLLVSGGTGGVDGIFEQISRPRLASDPYEDGSSGPLVAPVGSYDIAEVGEHLQFFAEDGVPFTMPRKHALQHHKIGHLEIEDWQS